MEKPWALSGFQGDSSEVSASSNEIGLLGIQWVNSPQTNCLAEEWFKLYEK